MFSPNFQSFLPVTRRKPGGSGKILLRQISFLSLILFYVLVLTPQAALAQATGTLEGWVTDAATGKALQGTEVVLKGTGMKARAGKDGRFRIAEIPAGSYDAVVKFAFYKETVIQVTVSAGKLTQVDFELVEKVVEMQRIVVTATLTEKDIEDIPNAVEVITRQEIEEMGAETAADVLRESQGLSMQIGSGRSELVNIRGLNANQSLVLVDGRRLAAGFQNDIDLADFPLSSLERIEIVRGPNSALYGSEAVGGVINLITRQPSERTAGAVSLRFGQSRYGEARTPFIQGDLSGKKGRVGYSIAGGANRKDDYDRDKSTFFTDGDLTRQGQGTGQLSLDLADNQRLQAGLDYSEVDREGKRTQSSGDGIRTQDSKRRTAFLEYNAEPLNRMNLLLRGYQSHYQTNILVSSVATGEGQTAIAANQDTYRLDQDLYQIESRLSGNLLERHLLTGGADFRQEKARDNTVDKDVNNAAAFLQDELKIGQALMLVLGARFDHHSEFGSVLNPKAGFTYSLKDSFRIKGSYGGGFRAPNIFELYVNKDTPKNLVHANARLGSETARAYELGAEGQYRGVFGKVTVFKNDLKDMINTVQVGVDTIKAAALAAGGGGGGGGGGGQAAQTRPIFEYRNIDRAMTQGVELSAEIRLPLGFSLSEEATLMDTEDKATSQRLFNRPDWLNVAKLSYRNSGLGVKANLRAMSLGNQKFTRTQTIGGFTYWNLYAAKKIFGAFELYGGVNNIFNANPALSGATDGQRDTGTFFYLGLTAEYR